MHLCMCLLKRKRETKRKISALFSALSILDGPSRAGNRDRGQTGIFMRESVSPASPHREIFLAEFDLNCPNPWKQEVTSL